MSAITGDVTASLRLSGWLSVPADSVDGSAQRVEDRNSEAADGTGMSDSLTSHLAQLEEQRVDALLAVDTARFDALHDSAYQLCNPTGTVWDKGEYLRRLTTGRLAYGQLDTASEIDVLAAETLAVLGYRCLIALRVDGTDIPTHECQHIDIYVRADDGRWRCRYSQATGIMDTIPTAAET